MTVNPVPTNPFPEVSTVEGLDDIWTAPFVECTGCIDLIPLAVDMDPVEWAKEHRKTLPWHRAFRVVTITNFGVPADDPAP